MTRQGVIGDSQRVFGGNVTSQAEAPALKLVAVYVVIFSLVGLPSFLVQPGSLPVISVGHAATIPPVISNWYPAGSSMNTELVNIFTSETAEYNALANGGVDLTDWPVSPTFCTSLPVTSGNIICTPPVAAHDYYEVEFDLSNNFWGCPFNFGNSACGVDIRQGTAHLVDKTVFTQTDPSLVGRAMALDNPVPPSDGLVTPNACSWDPLSPETNATTGDRCVVGNPSPWTGGVAYNLAPGSPNGLCGTETSQSACAYPWMRGFGSPDFCAAAEHLIHAGLAAGKDANCVLTGVNFTAVTGHPVNFSLRTDKPPRYRLGLGMAQTICALFTGSFTVGCTTTSGPTGSCIETSTTIFPTGSIFCVVVSDVFPGFTTCKSSTSTCPPFNNWWMYTAGFGLAFPFDSLLYFLYNSRFVSAPGPPCAATTTTSGANNYVYVCDPAYDTWSNAMEFASCLSATGDPVPGAGSNTVAGTCPASSGTCPSTPTACSGVSAGFVAEEIFGNHTFTIPIYSDAYQFGYLNNWQRVVNAQGVGLPNYFTWLNVYSPNPAVSGTVRQGFAQTTFSLNPYGAYTAQDFYILHNIYDSIYASNPLGPSQLIDWMTRNHSALPNSQLGYTPPAGTTTTIRNSLRNDNFWHDGQRVTPFDVAFSYLSLLAHGSYQTYQLVGSLVGVTVVDSSHFDLNFNTPGLSNDQLLASVTIIPGHLWYIPAAGCPANWSSVLISQLPAIFPVTSNTCLNTSSTKASPTFDPITNGILVGSGPWVCENTGANIAVNLGTVGTGCSSTNTQTPLAGGTFTLTRNGCTITLAGTSCLAPNSSVTSSYFRSSGTLALWIWTGMQGSISQDLLTVSNVAYCFMKPLGTAGCTHWQLGIGAPGGQSTVSLIQVSEVVRFFVLGWTPPYAWTSLAGIGGFPPVLYEGSAVLNPAGVVGCSQLYPVGGYDC